MKYLKTNYRDFIRQKLNEEMKKTELNLEPAITEHAGMNDWLAEMRIEFEKLMKESDEIYNTYWGKIH